MGPYSLLGQGTQCQRNPLASAVQPTCLLGAWETLQNAQHHTEVGSAVCKKCVFPISPALFLVLIQWEKPSQQSVCFWISFWVTPEVKAFQNPSGWFPRATTWAPLPVKDFDRDSRGFQSTLKMPLEKCFEV